MLVYNDGLYTIIVAKGFSDKIAYLYICFIILLLLYGYFIYYIKIRKNIFIPILFITGVFSTGSVVISFLPASSRLYIPFAIFSLLLIAETICNFFYTVRSKNIKITFIVLLVIVVAANVFNYTIYKNILSDNRPKYKKCHYP